MQRLQTVTLRSHNASVMAVELNIQFHTLGGIQIALKKIFSLQGIAILCSEKSCTSSIREASLGQIMINIG